MTETEPAGIWNTGWQKKDISFLSTQIMNLNASLGYIDPTHLPIYLTKDVVLYFGQDPFNCCEFGFHGGNSVPWHSNNGPTNGNGNRPVQTFAWVSYFSPGLYARPNAGTAWALQDIYGVSHEILEWADDLLPY
jgi:hypothetical protein